MQALGTIVPTLAIKIIEKLIFNDQPQSPNPQVIPQIIHVPQYLCCCGDQVNDHGYCNTCITERSSSRRLRKNNSPAKSKSGNSENGKLKSTSKSASSPNIVECKKSPNKMSRNPMELNPSDDTTLRVLNRQLEYGAKDFSRRPISEKVRAILARPLPCTEYMKKITQSEDAFTESTSSSSSRYTNLYTDERIQQSIDETARKAANASKNEEQSDYGRWLRTPSVGPTPKSSEKAPIPSSLYSTPFIVNDSLTSTKSNSNSASSKPYYLPSVDKKSGSDTGSTDPRRYTSNVESAAANAYFFRYGKKLETLSSSNENSINGGTNFGSISTSSYHTRNKRMEELTNISSYGPHVSAYDNDYLVLPKKTASKLNNRR